MFGGELGGVFERVSDEWGAVSGFFFSFLFLSFLGLGVFFSGDEGGFGWEGGEIKGFY